MNDDRAGASAGKRGRERVRGRKRGGVKSKSVGFSLNLVAAVTCEILYIRPHPRVDVSPIGRVRAHLDGLDRVERNSLMTGSSSKTAPSRSLAVRLH